MRIGIDIRSLQTGSRFAGIGTLTYNLVCAICNIDKENEYLFFADEGIELSTVDRLVEETGKKLVLLSHFVCKDFKWDILLSELSGPTVFFREKIDILIIPSLFESNIPVTMHTVSGKVFLVMYDLIPLIFKNDYFARFPLWWKHWYSYQLRNVSKADYIFAISECTKRDVVEYLGYSEDRIKVIYGGVNEYYKSDKIPIWTIKDSFAISNRYLLTVGCNDNRKNTEGLIKAFGLFSRQNDGYQLVVAGIISAESKCRFKNIAGEYGVEERVVFTNYINETELVGLYRGASLFVFPSFYEGLGLPVLEAMACGIPVIASNNSSIPEIVDKAGILVDPYNIEQIAKAIERVLSDTALRYELKVKGLERSKQFSWINAAQEIVNTYNKNIGKLKKIEASDCISKICQEEDWDNSEWLEIAKDIGLETDKKKKHRKTWEFTHAVYGLKKLGLLMPDIVALGIGSGHEAILYYFANVFKLVIATDIYSGDFTGNEADPGMLKNPEKYALIPYKKDNLIVNVMDGTKFTYGDNSFDLVFSFSSIEHFGSHKNATKTMKEITRVLKPGGVSVITTEVILNSFQGESDFFTIPQLFSDLIVPSGLRLVDGRINLMLPHKLMLRPVRYPEEIYKVFPHIVLSTGDIMWTSVIMFLKKF